MVTLFRTEGRMNARSRFAPRHAPDKMTGDYNRTVALSKVDMAPLDRLTDTMLDSIARSHKVPVDVLRQRLNERRQREASR